MCHFQSSVAFKLLSISVKKNDFASGSPTLQLSEQLAVALRIEINRSKVQHGEGDLTINGDIPIIMNLLHER